MMARAGKTMAVEDAALEMVVAKGYSLAFGARILKRVIDEQIKLPISARWKDGSHFDVKVVDGHILVEPGVATVATASHALALGDLT